MQWRKVALHRTPGRYSADAGMALDEGNLVASTVSKCGGGPSWATSFDAPAWRRTGVAHEGKEKWVKQMDGKK